MGQPARPSPGLADPQASAKIRQAAEAVGLTAQELGDLIFESGAASLPTSDGITERYTIEDLGRRLWAGMLGMEKPARATWFDGLVPTQKTAIIVLLRDRGFRTEIIAKDFGIMPADVMRTWNAYTGDLGTQVVGLRLDTIAGQLQLAAERAQQMAIEGGDGSAFWKIQKELVAAYQSIGIVDKAIHRVEVTHKMTDATRDEFEAVMELERKRERRTIEIEELKSIEDSGEALPAEVEEADYDA